MTEIAEYVQRMVLAAIRKGGFWETDVPLGVEVDGIIRVRFGDTVRWRDYEDRIVVLTTKPGDNGNILEVNAWREDGKMSS